MKIYKDFIIKTFIVTIAVLIVLQFILSPLKKTLRFGEILLNKVEIYEKQIKDKEFFAAYHQVLLNNVKEVIYVLADSDGISAEERTKIEKSITKILDRDIKPILENVNIN